MELSIKILFLFKRNTREMRTSSFKETQTQTYSQDFLMFYCDFLVLVNVILEKPSQIFSKMIKL